VAGGNDSAPGNGNERTPKFRRCGTRRHLGSSDGAGARPRLHCPAPLPIWPGWPHVWPDSSHTGLRGPAL